MQDLRPTLDYINMRKLSNISGVSYDIIKNYKTGKKQYFTDKEFNAIVNALKTIMIIGGIRI